MTMTIDIQIEVGDIKQWRGYRVEIVALNNKDQKCMIESRDPDRWLKGRDERLVTPYNQIYNLPRQQGGAV